MQVQVNSNQSIQTHDSLERWATTELTTALERFRDDVTRVEVHLSDENGDKAGLNHVRCMIEARLAGHQPQAVNHLAATLDEAFRGACEKIKRSLDHTLDKQHDHRARKSIRRDTDPEVL